MATNPPLPYEQLKRRLNTAESSLQAIRKGQVDTIVGEQENLVVRLEGAEETLKESEHKYRLLVENANETIMLVQAAQIVFINRQGEALLEFSQSELSSRPLGDFIHEEDRDMVLARHQRRLKGESLLDRYPFRIVSKSGQIKWVELKVAVVSWEGEPATLCFLSDITARRQAEIALRESERKFRDLFNSISDTVFIHDMQGRFVEVNEVACRIYGYSREEIRRMTPRDLDAPEDRRLFSERIQTLDQEGRLVFDAVHRRKDGGKFPVEIHSRKIEYQGHPCILSIVRDITRRKQTEQTLRKRTRDLQKRVKELNSLYGISNLVATPDISLDQIIQGVVELIPRSWRYPDIACARIVLEGKEYRTENFEETRWKQSGAIQVHGKPFGILEVCYIEEKPEADEGPFFKEERSLIAAVSERLGRIIERERSKKEKHMLENRLQQARKMEAIGTLAGGVAHEFNNALTAIMGNIELLKMDLAEGDRRDKYFRAMEQSGLRLSGLTNQLLAYARGGKYQATNLKIREFVIQTLPLLQYNLKPGVRVETHFAEHTAYVRADHTQMQMMLSAILDNANEAIGEEGVIKISADNQEVEEAFSDRHPGLDPGLYVCLSIEDDGTGMDEETRKGIFEPFFTTKFQGRGMGMAAVYGIVKNHDGWISVDSEVNKGTVVKIFLPAIEDTVKK
ncbi:MAG: PAS domain S-box protein [Desulfatiglandaceae bacterium]